MHEFNVITAVFGALVLGIALLSRRLVESPLSPPLVALLIGIAVGPRMLDWIDIDQMGDPMAILELSARLTLGIALVGVALRLPRRFVRRDFRSAGILIGIGMPLMWLVSTLLVTAILGVPLWLGALIGAAIAPTDPVAASAVITSSVSQRFIPARVRHTLSLESGINDGLAYPLVFLPLLLVNDTFEAGLTRWFAQILLWDVVIATLIGVALGAVSGKLLRYSERHGIIEDDWRLAYTAAVAVLAVGVGRLINTDEILLVFGAGMGLAQVISNRERKHEALGQETINRFFSVPIFTLFGLALPWEGWAELGWKGIVLAIAVLLLRRLPAVLLLRRYLPELRGRRDPLFAGWFGPIAISALYYATLVQEHIGDPIVWHVVSLVICSSVVVHGVTAAPFTWLYGRDTPPEPQDHRGRT